MVPQVIFKVVLVFRNKRTLRALQDFIFFDVTSGVFPEINLNESVKESVDISSTTVI